MKRGSVIGRRQGPLEEISGVVETEHAVVVLDVVVCEKVVYLVELNVLCDVKIGPYKSLGHVIWVLTKFRLGFIGYKWFVDVGGGCRGWIFKKHWLFHVVHAFIGYLLKFVS